MLIFVCLGEIKKVIGNDYEVTVMVRAGKYWKWPSKEDRIFYERLKRLKTLSTYQENIAWIKSRSYYSRNIEGDIRDNVPPSPNIGGRVPLSHMDRRPCT